MGGGMNKITEKLDNRGIRVLDFKLSLCSV
jgi:hypothetical protein